MGRIVKTAAVAGVTIAAAGVVVERTMIAAPHYHGPRTDHFDGERFHNLALAEPHGITDVLRWQKDRHPGFWREWVDAPPGPPPEQRVNGGRLRVTLVNHATMLVQMDGFNILTDPIWSMRCSPLQSIGPKRHRPPGIRFRDLPPIDAVLVSHNHYDHLDVRTLQRLCWRFSPRIVTPLGNGALMARHGIDGVTELDWWKATRVGSGAAALTITAVPAQHFCARALSDRNANLWGGFVISGPSGNVYFSGDTGWGPHFERIAATFSPIRLAMLPIGAYLPRWFMKPVHVDPAEAVEAHKILRARTSVAMHYGTFHLGDDGELQPLDDLRRAIAANGNPQFLILEHGVARDVEQWAPSS
jgi:L-ascorbate metabolism protein UlaG (beta-lactamase superfamily)